MDISRDYSSMLELYKNEEKEKSIAIKYPNLMEEWNYERNGEVDPLTISYGSKHLIWWRCKKGHSYQAVIYNKTAHNTGCLYCSNTKVLEGYNDLASRYPELLEEWDYSKNPFLPSDVLFGTEKKAYWRCKSCGY
ncbi:MAG: zinc-ribbon domain-containing protein [Aeriscardovia sp.]|nr:zinc-ribbon domain-containing protein [Aeriscardovia sp.]